MIKVFSQRLKKLRKASGYTQLQLADIIGVARTTVANWENGLRVPDVNTISEIAQIFDVTPDYLLYSSVSENFRDLKNIGIDVSRLNELGVEKLKAYYKIILSNKKYTV